MDENYESNDSHASRRTGAQVRYADGVTRMMEAMGKRVALQKRFKARNVSRCVHNNNVHGSFVFEIS